MLTWVIVKARIDSSLSCTDSFRGVSFFFFCVCVCVCVATSRKAPQRQRGTPLGARHGPPEGSRVTIYKLKYQQGKGPL